MVDQALDAIQPAGIQAALDTLDTARQDDATKRHAVELAPEKARYEARRAQSANLMRWTRYVTVAKMLRRTSPSLWIVALSALATT